MSFKDRIAERKRIVAEHNTGIKSEREALRKEAKAKYRKTLAEIRQELPFPPALKASREEMRLARTLLTRDATWTAGESRTTDKAENLTINDLAALQNGEKKLRMIVRTGQERFAVMVDNDGPEDRQLHPGYAMTIVPLRATDGITRDGVKAALAGIIETYADPDQLDPSERSRKEGKLGGSNYRVEDADDGKGIWILIDLEKTNMEELRDDSRRKPKKSR